MTKKENVLEKCRINLDKEKVLHSITRGERDKYKERIDKAIEYIKSKQYRYWDYKGNEYIGEDMFEEDTNPIELLDILKGEDKE